MDIYNKSFSRNLGVISKEEQVKLKNATVGIAGLGGIGGATAMVLTRAGIGNYLLADLDEFDYPNFNRQAGANVNTVGKQKIEVIKNDILSINPNSKIQLYYQGIKKENVEEFVKNCDVIVDSIDYFTMSARYILHVEARKQGKPVVFSAPLGFSATFMSFTKDSMSFEDFFAINEKMDPFEKVLNFTIGLAPKATHRAYMEFKAEDLIALKTGPSFSTSVYLGAAIIGVEVTALITNNKKNLPAPYYTQIDLFTSKFYRKRLLFGNRNPIQWIKLYFARRMYGKYKSEFLKMIN